MGSKSSILLLPDIKKTPSMAYTRFRLAGITPVVGECPTTNKDEPILRLVCQGP